MPKFAMCPTEHGLKKVKDTFPISHGLRKGSDAGREDSISFWDSLFRQLCMLQTQRNTETY